MAESKAAKDAENEAPEQDAAAQPEAAPAVQGEDLPPLGQVAEQRAADEEAEVQR